MQTPESIQRIYLILIGGNTLAASLIWGINTIFLLNAGLSNFEAFAANAFFTLGQVLFEVPTGVIADSWGRRISYLLGTIILLLTTFLYWFMWYSDASFFAWAIVSIGLGLGFTFFSGAFEAWVVDALHETGYQGSLDAVFARGQIMMGIAMLIGSIAGGIIAQITNLGVPYLFRVVLLAANFMLAYIWMKDLGFKAEKHTDAFSQMAYVLRRSLHSGLGNQRIKWVMLAAPFSTGISFYIFYALQPYLLLLYGDETAYWIAGLVAAIVAGAQILGGILAPQIRQIIKKPLNVLLVNAISGSVILAFVGIVPSFYPALLGVILWALLFSAVSPIRQRYLNENINSKERATILSFDNLLSSTGGISFQPILGKAADVWGYPASYIGSSIVQLFALPFLFRAKKESKTQ